MELTSDELSLKGCHTTAAGRAAIQTVVGGAFRWAYQLTSQQMLEPERILDSQVECSRGSRVLSL